LREETGYVGENARLLGRVLANPAILNNFCYIVLVENCRLAQGLDMDPGEDLETQLVPETEVLRLVAEGKIQHSLVVGALFHFDLWRRGMKDI